jgi:1-aminocyclopropane-1-carboxylate deaminase/D-cysteine desulfhydrase-like pyridoxal-dependent ACC family enzyme
LYPLEAKLGALARVRLASLPTAMSPAQRLARSLGIAHLWFKRDDLIGFGFGGNKVRGLEFLLADAIARQADIVVTGAGPQSNHVRATAAAAAFAGIESLAILWGSPPPRTEGNYLLTRMLGGKVRFTGNPDRASVDAEIESVVADMARAGRRPYGIPRGGACALGVAAHILAVYETAAHCAESGIRPDLVLLAAGSGATYAGWLLGVKSLHLPWRVESVTVSRPAVEVRRRVLALGDAAAETLDLPVALSDGDVVVHDGFIGEGYGIASAEGMEAIRLTARTEGIFLDPTYTGKAFAGLAALISRGRVASEDTVIFVHTGGAPALFTARAEVL